MNCIYIVLKIPFQKTSKIVSVRTETTFCNQQKRVHTLGKTSKIASLWMENTFCNQQKRVPTVGKTPQPTPVWMISFCNQHTPSCAFVYLRKYYILVARRRRKIFENFKLPKCPKTPKIKVFWARRRRKILKIWDILGFYPPPLLATIRNKGG